VKFLTLEPSIQYEFKSLKLLNIGKKGKIGDAKNG